MAKHSQERQYGGRDSRPVHRAQISPQKPGRGSRRNDSKRLLKPVHSGPNFSRLQRLQSLRAAAKVEPLAPSSQASSASPAPSAVSGEPRQLRDDMELHEEVLGGDGDGLHDRGVADASGIQVNNATPATRQPNPRLLGPSERSTKYFAEWTSLLPKLIQPLVDFLALTEGGQKPTPPIQSPERCSTRGCKQSTRHILCISQYCKCYYLGPERRLKCPSCQLALP